MNDRGRSILIVLLSICESNSRDQSRRKGAITTAANDDMVVSCFLVVVVVPSLHSYDDPGDDQHCQSEEDMIKTTDCVRAISMEEIGAQEEA